MNLIDSLDQSKRSIGVNNQLKSNNTLTRNFKKYTRKENPYVQFLYSPHKIYNHTPGQVIGSINTDTITVKKVNNQQR